MFSANENIALRKHKRRVIEYVEETIPDSHLDEGTTVLCMQVSCRAPGCVPLETVITICFPSVEAVLPNLDLTGTTSKSKTTFQTKILMPMSEITKEDVLEALPPAFEGGRQSMERLGLRARDVMLAQVTQLFDDVGSRKIVADYLKECLQDFMDRDCEAPEYGEPFAELVTASGATENSEKKAVDTATGANASTVASIQAGTGNLVIRRVLDDDEAKKDDESATTTTTTSSERVSAPPATASANDWRRQQTMERQINNTINMSGSAQLLSQLEHAPGVRRPGCPCCDPDSASNYVDSMMML